MATMLNIPLVNEVDSMKPGDCIILSKDYLEDHIPGFYHNSVYFTPADRVLGNIIGSAYEFSFTVSPFGDVTFFRHTPEHNKVFYIAPDRH